MALSAIVITSVVGINIATKPSSDTRTRASENKDIPQEIRAENLTSNSADIRWYTTENSQGKVVYTTNSIMCDTSTLDQCDGFAETESVQDHKINLSNLQPNTLYIYKVLMNNALYPDDPLTFKTLPDDFPNTPNVNDNEKVNDQDNGNQKVEPDNFTPDSKPTTPDYEGIIIEKPTDTKQKSNTQTGSSDSTNIGDDSYGVLGKQTNIIDQMIVEEFTEAMKYNDKNYDFNKDGKVTNADYPLFIEFIRNKED